MTPEPVLDLLRRRWRLGQAGCGAVTALLAVEERGHSWLALGPCAAADELRSSGAAGAGAGATPLVLAGGRLYLRRLWQAEQDLARDLAALVRSPAPAIPPGDPDLACLGTLLPRLERQQAVAVASALGQRLSLITGGPGTGKTHTVAALLACLLARTPGLAVRLAAPTGRAAAQLRDAIAGQQAVLRDDEVRARLAGACSTIHRLLGLGGPGGARYRAGAWLPCDLLVVDEVSMVDVELMRRLVAALPPHARLVLLGDRHQLASVETGYVLGDLAGLARPDAGDDRVSATLAARLQAVPGMAAFLAGNGGALAVDPVQPALAGVVATLRRSRRFAADHGIGRLALAVNQGDGIATLAELPPSDGPLPPDGTWVARVARPRLLALAAEGYRAVLAAGEPDQALAAFAGLRVLAAVRRGPDGVDGLNRAIERLLGLHSTRSDGHYHGRAVLVRRNDPGVALANGDAGLVLADAEGVLRAWFPAPGGGARAVPLAQLPPHDTGWAMTVHQAQGSGFATVLCCLPDADPEGGGPLARELLYTAVTRARERLAVCAGEAALTACVATSAARRSGFAEALERHLA